MKAFRLWGLAAVFFPPIPVDAQTTPDAAASGFLSVYGSFHPSDGIPDAAGRARLAPYLSSGLNALLANGAAAQARFSAKAKDSPPLIEGDLFSSMFEGPTQWKLQACTINADQARCPVAFTHASSGTKAINWTDTLLLLNSPQGWRVDDIVYGGGFQFGNTGRLSDTLRTVASESP
ncbi:MAG TPA: hypothetical protein VKB67_15425 [Rhizomicrobium sp.]|nr:hypothetical protein [Rhizomicrobium sp.]